MGHYASAHQDLEAQQLRAHKALFLKENSGSREAIQGKWVTIIEEEDKNIILAVSVTL